jgi:60kDa lysophospholipase
MLLRFTPPAFSSSSAMAFVQPSDETKVLVIYTGGTIGMLLGQSGYVPEPSFLTETLRSQARFHDPLQASLFSHSSSVQGWRDWSAASTGNSGRTTPNSGISSPIEQSAPTLAVRSSRPIGTLRDSISVGTKTRQPTCVKVEKDVYESALPALVTPKSSVPGGSGKRICYAVLEVGVESGTASYVIKSLLSVGSLAR